MIQLNYYDFKNDYILLTKFNQYLNKKRNTIKPKTIKIYKYGK